MALPASLVGRTRERIDRLVGGPARRRVITVFAAALALDSADKATIGANATQLKDGLGIDNADIGLLLAVSSLIGAVATLPAGALVDRTNRIRLLAAAVAAWGVAMVLSGVAPDYLFLLLARLALGAVTAIAGPAVASMIGDYFPQDERGRVWGYVLSGELIGAGFGFVIAGQVAALSWRAPFFLLVPPTALVWWLVHRLPEPERGGASRLPSGSLEIGAGGTDAGRESAAPPPETDLAHQAARDADIEPRADAVLHDDPRRMNLAEAVRRVLRVRTNVVLIVASALGYFFFSGLRGFALEFAKHHYRLSQSAASALTLLLGIGALGGVLLGGRLADRLLRGGRLPARVEVSGVASLGAAALFVPALITRTAWVAVLLLVLAALCLGATNPPLDAARLDIMPPLLWGRAEAVRTALRNGADAAAPVVFGLMSTVLFTGSAALEYTFLLMLTSLVAAAVIVLVAARRTYPQDVAAAARSTELTQ